MHSLRVGTRGSIFGNRSKKEDPMGTGLAVVHAANCQRGRSKSVKGKSHTRFRAWIEETRALFREAMRRDFIVDGSTCVAAGAEMHNGGPPR